MILCHNVIDIVQKFVLPITHAMKFCDDHPMRPVHLITQYKGIEF